jgi:hypothetical protein
MKVNFFSKIGIDSKDLTQKLTDALDKDGYYLVFKWNKGPIVVFYQLTLFDANDITVANFLGDTAIKDASGDISIFLGNLKGLKKGKLVLGIRAVDDVAKCAVFLIQELATKNTVVIRIPADEKKFLKIEAGKDLDKNEIKFDLTINA